MTGDELERLGRLIDGWDPDQGDLPDEVALAMDAQPALRARFDARFARWSGAEAAPPDDLAARVLPRRRREWPCWRCRRWGRWRRRRRCSCAPAAWCSPRAPSPSPP
ncbi:MAG: hypothetical protein R3F59_09020 [Myxococcota bacterium]